MDLASIALEALSEFPSTPVVIFDREGRCVAVFGKRLPEEMIVGGRDAIVGRLPEEYMGEEAAGFRRTLASVLASGESALIRSHSALSGSDFAYEVTLWPLVDALLVACVIRNVSEADRLRRELDATESRMQAVFEHTAQFLLELTADGTIVYVGSRARDLSVEPATLVGTNARDVAQLLAGLHPADAPLLTRSMTHFVETPAQWSPQVARLRDPEGGWRVFDCSGGWYPGPDGTRRGMLVFRESLTARDSGAPRPSEPAATEQTLESLQRNNLVLLAGGVAHDFNNLLAISLGIADLIAEQLPDGSPIRPYLAEIVTASRQAADLSRQLLAATGKAVSASLIPIDLNDVIRSQESLLRTGVPKSVKVEYLPCDGQLWVDGDATQLRQVLLNLVTNAGEALGEKRGAIRVETGRARDQDLPNEAPLREWAVVEVSDDGPGLDGAVRSRIFEPSFSTKTRGSGLGLAVVENVVRRHGGRIHVANANPQGTIFRIEIPLLPEHAVQAKSEFALNLAQAIYSDVEVLIVDDDDGVRRVFASMLGVAKFRVFEASGAQAALALVEREPSIACAVVDLIMPDSDGLALIDALRQRRPGLRVVLCSGALNRIPSDRSDLVVLEKPFRYGQLIEAVWRALEASS